MSEAPNIRIVLVNTSHPGNIGSAARAMKTMGLSDLTLVAPVSYPNAKATELAAGADDLLYRARVVSTLEEAIEDCQFIVGTSARVRELPQPEVTPREAAEEVMALGAAQVAIVFGREKSGLTNQELNLCHRHLVIPSNPAYSSLNLAAAVQVICYECRMAHLAQSSSNSSPTQQEPLAQAADVERFHQHLADLLLRVGFYDPDNPKKTLLRIRRLFNRLALEVNEVNILRGILTAIDKRLGG